MGEGIVEKLKREFDLSVLWRGVEIHPETPPEGIPMTERFRPEDISRMMGHLRSLGAPYGLTFVDRPLLSNSRLALQAAEFSREAGAFEAFHEALFAAYFSQGLDIGELDVLSGIAEETGLESRELRRALESGKYVPALEAAKEEASRLSVTGVPTFLVGGKKTIVGAQPLDVFRKTLQSLSAI